MINVVIMEAGENLDLKELKNADIIVRGDVIVKDTTRNAGELFMRAATAKSLGTIIEEMKPDVSRDYRYTERHP